MTFVAVYISDASAGFAASILFLFDRFGNPSSKWLLAPTPSHTFASLSKKEKRQHSDGVCLLNYVNASQHRGYPPTAFRWTGVRMATKVQDAEFPPLIPTRLVVCITKRNAALWTKGKFAQFTWLWCEQKPGKAMITTP